MLFLWPKNLPNHQPDDFLISRRCCPEASALGGGLTILGPKTSRNAQGEGALLLNGRTWGEKSRNLWISLPDSKNGNDRFVIINYRIKYTYRTEKGDIICIYSLHVIFRIYIWYIYIYMIYIYMIYIYEIHTYLYYIYIYIHKIYSINLVSGRTQITNHLKWISPAKPTFSTEHGTVCHREKNNTSLKKCDFP